MSDGDNVSPCIIEFLHLETGQRSFGRPLDDSAFMGKTGLVAGAFEEPFFFPMIDPATEMGAFSGYGPRWALFALEEDEVRAQEKSAGGEGGLDFNQARLRWHLVAKKAQNRIAEGQQADDQKETPTGLWWPGVRVYCGRHDTRRFRGSWGFRCERLLAGVCSRGLEPDRLRLRHAWPRL